MVIAYRKFRPLSENVPQLNASSDKQTKPTIWHWPLTRRRSSWPLMDDVSAAPGGETPSPKCTVRSMPRQFGRHPQDTVTPRNGFRFPTSSQFVVQWNGNEQWIIIIGKESRSGPLVAHGGNLQKNDSSQIPAVHHQMEILSNLNFVVSTEILSITGSQARLQASPEPQTTLPSRGQSTTQLPGHSGSQVRVV